MISPRIANIAARRVTTAAAAAACTRAQSVNQTTMASVQLQRRNAGTAGGRSEPDMGGPGGQEAYPFTNKKHRYFFLFFFVLGSIIINASVALSCACFKQIPLTLR